MFLPQQHGGLGMPAISTLYKSTRASKACQLMLSSDKFVQDLTYQQVKNKAQLSRPSFKPHVHTRPNGSRRIGCKAQRPCYLLVLFLPDMIWWQQLRNLIRTMILDSLTPKPSKTREDILYWHRSFFVGWCSNLSAWFSYEVCINCSAEKTIWCLPSLWSHAIPDPCFEQLWGCPEVMKVQWTSMTASSI